MNNTKKYIRKYGNKDYFNLKGQYHRLDGPAREYRNGSKFWYKDGKRHRLDGPAIESVNGSKVWYKEGKRHRTDGPAWEYTNGKKYWGILDKECEEKWFNSWINRIQIFI